MMTGATGVIETADVRQYVCEFARRVQRTPLQIRWFVYVLTAWIVVRRGGTSLS